MHSCRVTVFLNLVVVKHKYVCQSEISHGQWFGGIAKDGLATAGESGGGVDCAIPSPRTVPPCTRSVKNIGSSLLPRDVPGCNL